MKTSLLETSKPVTVHIPTDNYDYKEIRLGIMANFIHSLDAANIHILINIIRNSPDSKIDLYTIHDCFASTNADMARMESLVKRAFTQLYFNADYLQELHHSILNQIRSYAQLTEKIVGGKKVTVLTPDDKAPNIGRAKNKEMDVIIPELPDFK